MNEGRDLVTPKKEGYCLGLCNGEWGRGFGKSNWKPLHSNAPLICSIQCPYGLVYTCLGISWAKRTRNTLTSVRESDSQKYKRLRSIIWIHLSSLPFFFSYCSTTNSTLHPLFFLLSSLFKVTSKLWRLTWLPPSKSSIVSPQALCFKFFNTIIEN